MIYTGFSNLKKADGGWQFSDILAEVQKFAPNEPQGPADKATRQKWLADPKTDYCVFSVWEGLFPEQRINARAGNPPHKLHGLVADYDAPSPASLPEIGATIDQILGATPLLRPQFIVRSPGNNHRLVWEFDRPLIVSGAPDSFVVALLDELKRLLQLPKLLANLDEAALKKPATPFDIGGTWERHNDAPLPIEEVHGAFQRAVQKASRTKTPGGPPALPMDVVFKHIQKLYPGKWPEGLPFEDGVQGPAVWDPDAKNTRSTIYHPTGVWCFSAEDKPFKPYKEILGADVVRQWEENKIGAACADIYYVAGAGYFRKWPDGHWRLQPKEDLSLYLAGAQNLSRAKGANNTPSEAEMALLHIQQIRVLDGAIPVVYDKREVVEMSGKRLLNISRVKAMEPDDSPGKLKWSRDPNKCPFSWIAAWLGDFLEDKRQLIYLLTWMRIFWKNAREGTPVRGHAMFLVGGTDRGKTLLNATFMPMIMGGGCDAGEFLVQGKQFNKNLLEVGHWNIDDNLAASDAAAHQRFSERIKALIANPKINYRPMYVDTQEVPFNGRTMITLNGDAGSLKMIPDLDRNIEDKIIILKLNDKSPFRFKGQSHTARMLREQTPHFLKWLNEWEPPEHICSPEFRFGMKHYISSKIRFEATVHSYEADILGVLEMLWDSDDELVSLRNKGEPWVGTAAKLAQIIIGNRGANHLVHGMTVRSIGMRLSKLSRTAGSGISAVGTCSKHKGQSPQYKIQPPPL